MLGKSISVKELISRHGALLKLTVVSGGDYLDRVIKTGNVNRPGLALTGHLDNFRSERIQIIGRGEYAFCLKSDPDVLLNNLKAMLSEPEVPCVIITGGLEPPLVLAQACAQTQIPLLSTALDTSDLIVEVVAILSEALSPSTRVHGVLVNVYGLGVLIQGGAGIGKSECALELVKRGHILVADDIVEIERKRGSVLNGKCPVMLQHYMEVRGLGIIDVEMLFGVGAILESSPIEMEVRLLPAEKQHVYDRIGLEQNTSRILDVDIPSISIPVTPGRNLAVLIEVAALNQRLKKQGIFSSREFNDKLIMAMTNAKTKKD